MAPHNAKSDSGFNTGFLAIFELSINFVALMFCIIILLILVYRLHCNTGNTNNSGKCCTPKKCMRNLTYSAIISYVMTMAIATPTDLPSSGWTDVELILFGISVISLWNFGQIFIYILLIMRVYYAFKETKYESTKTIKTTFVILIIVYSLCSILFPASILFGNNANLILHLLIAWAAAAEALDLIICVFLIIIFTKKMILIAVDIQLRNEIKLNSYESYPYLNNEIKLNHRQKTLLNIMTKYFILSCIPTIFAQIVVLLKCLYWTMNYNMLSEWIFVIIFRLYFMCCTLCLFLTFQINDTLYKRICNVCNGFVMRCCEWKTKRKINELQMRLFSKEASDSNIAIEYNVYEKIYNPPDASMDLEPMDLESIDLELWNEKHVMLWILLLEDGLFNKYKQDLEKEILDSQLSGMDLLDIDMNDIANLGIKKFSDRKILQRNIQNLSETRNFKNQKEGGDQTNYL